MIKLNNVLYILIILTCSNCSIITNSKEKKNSSVHDSVYYYSDLAIKYYKAEEMDKSREAFKGLLEYGEPKRLTDVILGKRLFFVPDSFIVPEVLAHRQFILKPLKEIHTELDYKAVMSSVDHLTGVLGNKNWPGDLTIEEDRNALKSHEWEFKHRTGFAYTVLIPSEKEIIGCVYINPSRLDDYDSEIGLWVTEKEFNKGTDEVLFNAVDTWLKNNWPFKKVIYPGRKISWGEFFDKLDKQDSKYEN